MSIQEQLPAVSQHLARAMEQLGGFDDQTLFAIEDSAKAICECFARGGKLMILTTPGLQGLALTLQFDLMHQYKNQQPALPTIVLEPSISDNSLTKEQLHQADALACSHDMLIIICDNYLDMDMNLLQQLYQFREVSCVYTGPINLEFDPSSHFTAVPLETNDVYSQRESLLFTLHCLSSRVQAMLFGEE